MSFYLDKCLGSGRANTIQTLKTCEGLVKNGIQVKLYAPFVRNCSLEKIYSEYGIKSKFEIRKVIHFPFLKFVLNSFVLLYHFLRDDNQIVYTRNIYFAFLASLTRRLVVYEAHQYSFARFYHTWSQTILLKILSKQINFILIVISYELKKKFRGSGIYTPMLVCHDGFDDNEEGQKKDNENLCVEKSPFETIAMYTGSLKRSKGLEHIEYLASKNKNVMFYVIGDNNKFCDKKIVHKLGMYDNIIMVGYIEHSKIYNYLKKADILLLLPTSRGEYNDVTSPLKLFEYMFAGKAILTTDMPTFREVLKDRYHALIAQDNNLEVDSKFKILVQDKYLRNRLGNNARQEVSKYSWEKRAKKIIEYISERIIVLYQ